jgi:16S rRNA (uracil1498-N3)-methyltransferase
MQHRFYLPEDVEGARLSICDPDQLHHLQAVLRLKIGDEVATFDGRGREYVCRILAVSKGQVVLEVVSAKEVQPRGPRITIACAVPRNVKMDDIVDKLTQLGVDCIIPLRTERVVVDLRDRGEAKVKRWRKIAQSASEQSGRSFLPEIGDILDLPVFLGSAADFEIKLIPTLFGQRRKLRDLLKPANIRSAAVLIGPEGDFTGQEVEQATQVGFTPVSLGEQVLRVDTAAIALAAYLRLSLGE